jgi:hypothetical protein
LSNKNAFRRIFSSPTPKKPEIFKIPLGYLAHLYTPVITDINVADTELLLTAFMFNKRTFTKQNLIFGDTTFQITSIFVINEDPAAIIPIITID